MQQIATFLMFVGDQYGRAEEAVRLYVSLFEDSRVVDVEEFGPGVKRVRFVLAGREHIALDSGEAHPFTFTPAMSLFVGCDTEQQVDDAYAALVEGGSVLMPLQEYPFSPRFAWIQDRFGVSWQLSVAG